MDENNTQVTQDETQGMIAAIHERIASLDAPVRELLLSDQYVITLGELATLHSLDIKDIGIMEEITTNFLLGTIKPNELEQTYIEDLAHLNKEKIQSLYKDIRVKILSPVWNIIEAAWAEDDENEQIWNDAVELSEVPLPPRLQSNTVQTLGQRISRDIDQGKEAPQIIESIRPNRIISNEEIVERNKAPKPEPVTTVKAPEPLAQSWEEKLGANQHTDPIVSARASTDVTLPRVKRSSGDIYRESPEE